MRIIKASKQHIEACLAVARELPGYFNALGMAAMRQDLQEHRLYAAVDANAIIGFAAVQPKSSPVAEISWMAVRPERQHQGVGTRLIDEIISDLRAEGVRLLEVKTLAAEADYAPYELTRRFYERRGFVHLDTIDPFPEWEPGNPCAIYIKII